MSAIEGNAHFAQFAGEYSSSYRDGPCERPPRRIIASRQRLSRPASCFGPPRNHLVAQCRLAAVSAVAFITP